MHIKRIYIYIHTYIYMYTHTHSLSAGCLKQGRFCL